MRTVLISTLLALTGTSSALAAPLQNLMGGRVVTQRAAWVSAGYADVEGGIRFPFGDLDVGVRGRFAFPAGCCGGEATPFAFVPAADLRWQLFDGGEITGALIGSVPVHLGFGSGFSFAVGVGLLHPGWMMTFNIDKIVDIDFGLQFQDDLWIGPGAVVFLAAVPLIAGVEVKLTDAITLGFRFEGGPAFAISSSTYTVYGLGPVTVNGGGVGARIRANGMATFAF